MKMDARRRQEHQNKNTIITDKTDKDTKGRQKGLEEEIRVVTWDVNKSSAQYDFLRDMAQCQANVCLCFRRPRFMNSKHLLSFFSLSVSDHLSIHRYQSHNLRAVQYFHHFNRFFYRGYQSPFESVGQG